MLISIESNPARQSRATRMDSSLERHVVDQPRRRRALDHFASTTCIAAGLVTCSVHLYPSCKRSNPAKRLCHLDFALTPARRCSLARIFFRPENCQPRTASPPHSQQQLRIVRDLLGARNDLSHRLSFGASNALPCWRGRCGPRRPAVRILFHFPLAEAGQR
jgi:hypothetical protein